MRINLHSIFISNVGVDILNKAVQILSEGEPTSNWPSVLLEVTTSEVKTIDCIVRKLFSFFILLLYFINFPLVERTQNYNKYKKIIKSNPFKW